MHPDAGSMAPPSHLYLSRLRGVFHACTMIHLQEGHAASTQQAQECEKPSDACGSPFNSVCEGGGCATA
jgi:hypothetical protein